MLFHGRFASRKKKITIFIQRTGNNHYPTKSTSGRRREAQSLPPSSETAEHTAAVAKNTQRLAACRETLEFAAQWLPAGGSAESNIPAKKESFVRTEPRVRRASQMLPRLVSPRRPFSRSALSAAGAEGHRQLPPVRQREAYQSSSHLALLIRGRSIPAATAEARVLRGGTRNASFYFIFCTA